MGSTQEIHDRERELARMLLIRLARHLREHEHAHTDDPREENGGFDRVLDFKIGSTPLTLHLHVHP
ncbi:MAG: hypothetical protein VM34scaffold347_19 [Phage 66_12]|jgi:hypothetical protein|nr:MAG: hypothetical protein VM34scaffold347_19 [Phage 66_12]